MKTIITNLITREELIFVNNLTLTENIVNAIISNDKRIGSLLDQDYRNSIKEKYPIKESTSKITNRQFAYCEAKNLHAKNVE